MRNEQEVMEMCESGASGQFLDCVLGWEVGTGRRETY